MGSVPILRVYINVTMDTVLRFDANSEANFNFEAKYQWTSKVHLFGIMIKL